PLTGAGCRALTLAVPDSEAERAVNAAKMPYKQWAALMGNADTEINPWLVVAPDDTMTIRVAQSEMGQQTFTSWSKMICEELECDWSKVRAEYASVNRHFRENTVYRRLATNASGAVRISR